MIQTPEYRSRIVAKDLKTKRDPIMPAIDTFAPMPALEMLKLMLSLASEWRKSRRGGSLTIMVVDVKLAHWNADARRVIYIQLPDEDYEKGMCGLALKALYGFLDAASCWNEEVGTMLVGTMLVGTLSRWLMMKVRTSLKPALQSDTNTARKGV